MTGPATPPLRLVADIGGTNARFALARQGRAGQTVQLAAAGHARFEDVLEAALELLPEAATAAEVAIAAAGPVVDGIVDVTNLPWRIDAHWLSHRLDGAAVRLVNDLEAVALALPALGADADAVSPLRAVETPTAGRAMIAVNVGTGFGAATAVPTAAGWTALPGEPGHMAFAARTEAECGQLGACHSVEDMLSGRGLAALCRRLGGAAEAAEEVFAAEQQAAREAVQMFAGALGRVTGDLVLATGAWSGAYLCGSLVSSPRGPDFDAAFLAAFDDKGAMAPHLARVPVHRITAANPALDGLAAMAF